MAAGLLFVHTGPGAGPVTEAEFRDWVGDQHAVAGPIVCGALRRALGFRNSLC
jgi:hypothetical protein